jgi:UDP-2-acetamido-3-amino-2,3-dideoxy-glucuronate N-acetyltransferase
MEKDYFAHETAVIDEGCTIGSGTRIWHFSHIMTDAVIGEHCNIGQNVVISPGVKLGKNVKVQNNVSIYTGVICEDDVFLGPSMVFTNITNPRSAVIRRDQYVTTMVRRGASIGANATIICGNEIGEYSLIGAGAVITRNVRPYALVIGNPGRQTGWVSEYGHKLAFDADGIAICPESKQKYRLSGQEVTKII